MKRWIVIVAVLVCCGVYAMVKLSTSQHQEANIQEEETPSANQVDADNTGKATPEEDSGTRATAVQIEAATKVFSEFQSALKSEDHERAWMCMSESVRSKASLEEFKKMIGGDEGAMIMESIIRPESSTYVGGRMGLRVAHPSLGEERFFFIQEDGQWKLDP